MIIRSAWLILLALSVSSCTSEQDLHSEAQRFLPREIWRVTAPLNEPVRLRVYRHFILVADMQAAQPFPLWDTAGTFMGYLGSGWGEGPEEFSRYALPVGGFNDSMWVVLDLSRGRTVALAWPSRRVYGSAYTGFLEGATLSRSRMVYPLREGKYLLALRPFALRQEQWSLAKDTLYWGPIDSIEAFQPLRNSPFLRSMALNTDAAGQVLVAFRWASIIATFSPEGTLGFLTDAPWHVSFPPHWDMRVAPSPATYPEQYLDVAADASVVYALYSGKKLEIRGAGDLTRLLTGEMEVEVGQTIACFDQRTGALLDTLHFPFNLRSLDARDGALYVLTTEPSLIKYAAPCVR